MSTIDKILPQDKTFLMREYLKVSKALLIDQNASARVGIKKLLVDLGAPMQSIFSVSNLEEAEAIVEQESPNIVFCDYQVGSKFGLDLLQKHRSNTSKLKEALFILVTSNTSQSAVAQAAEEDVDAFILKPYTLESFVVALARSIQIKVSPPEYLQLINKGKKLIEQNLLDEAIKIFGLAMTKESKPSLACYYEGLVNLKKEMLDFSRDSYNRGLGYNKIHYKCLVGLFDLLISQKQFDAAYQIVQRIVKFFPANPKRLSAVLRLAIQTKHYDDINTFYEEFIKLDERHEDLIKSVCAALIVCSRHFFESSETLQGKDLIQKAVVTAAGKQVILVKAVKVLVEYAELEEAKKVLKRFVVQSEHEPFFAAATLIILSQEQSSDLVASKGLELIASGLSHPDIYSITIDHLIKLGRAERAADIKVKFAEAHPELFVESKKAI